MATIQQRRMIFGNDVILPAFQLKLVNGILTKIYGPDAGTDTRASWDTRYNSAGVLEPISNNVPAHEWDPVTLAPLGRRFQGQKAKILISAEDFSNAAWTKSSANITGGKFIPQGPASVTHNCFQSLAVSVGTTYTIYFEADAAELTLVQLSFGSAGFGASAYVNYNMMGGGVIGTVGASIISQGIRKLINGRYAMWMSAVCTTASSGLQAGFFSILSLASARSEAYPADSISGFYPRAMQMEAGGLSSYLSSGIRQADTLIYPTTGWFNPLEGTFIVKGGIYPGSYTDSSRDILQINTGNDRLLMRYASSQASNTPVGFIGSGSGLAQGSINGAPTTFERYAFGYSTQANGFFGRNTGAGSSMVTISGIYSGVAATSMQIGAGANAYFTEIAYFPRLLSQAKASQLIA